MAAIAFICVFITPIIAVVFFVNCVSLAKKIKYGNQDTANNTGWGAVMLGFIVFSIIWSAFLK